MKKVIKILFIVFLTVFVLLTALLLLLPVIFPWENPVPEGYIRSEEHWEQDAFQDSIDFCIYYYDTADHVKSASEYWKVTEGDIEKITGYFKVFRQIMQAVNRLDEYSFDPECISAGDYCYIKTKEGEPIGDSAYGKYDDFTVCFFDAEALTLYYIHCNI